MKTLRLRLGLGGAKVGMAGRALAGMACLVMGFVTGVQAQAAYDPTLEVSATFYDFRSDRSNPEFEQPHGKYQGKASVARTGMIEDTLDADEKPIAKRDDNAGAYLNHGIRFWFRDNSKLTTYTQKTHPKGYDGTYPSGRDYLTKFRPVYMYNSDGSVMPPGIRDNPNPDRTGGEWDAIVQHKGNAYTNAEVITLRGGSGRDNSNNDVASAYENSVIPAKLIFQLSNNTTEASRGVYKFESDNFFPLKSGNPSYTVTTGRVVFDATTPTVLSDFSGGSCWTSQGTKNDNYSFTMEVKTKFQMRDGLTFNFKGDDDVWLFINKKLVTSVDIGGIHESVEGDVNLDNAAVRTRYGLKLDSTYVMHLFYCERHSNDSKIRITTNIVSSRLSEIKFDITGGDIKAGVDKQVTATVTADTGGGQTVLTTYPGEFTWTVVDQGGYNTSSELTVKPAGPGTTLATSNKVNINAQKAYTWVKLTGCYKENNAGQVCKDTLMWVGPGDPDKVWIEASADSVSANLRNQRPVNTINIDQTEYVENFYAIVRDKFGNWVSRAGVGSAPVWQNRTMRWPTDDATIATAVVAPGNTVIGTSNVKDSTLGRGRAVRVITTEGSTWLRTAYTWPGFSLKSDSARVTVGKINYTDIRIVDKNGLPIAGGASNPGTINMTVGADTTLYAELYDPVNKIWIEMPVTWGVTGVPGVTAPAGSVRNIAVKPTGETTASGGSITATYEGKTATVKIIAVNMDPAITRIFSKRGQPDFTAKISSYLLPGDGPDKYVREYVMPNDFVTVTAGASLPLVSKLFTETTPSKDSWLDVSTQGIGNRWTWSFVSGSPTNAGLTDVSSALSATTGDSVSFKSTVAHEQYRIRVVYSESGKTPVQQEIIISVVPDIRTPQLFIEREWDITNANKNTPLKVDELTFATTDREKSVYAILRDQYGNYIAPSGAAIPAEYGSTPTIKNTVWSPSLLESTGKIVYAVNGQTTKGEGNVIRTELDGGPEMLVTVKDNTFDKTATVPVRVLNYYYEDIQIVKKCDGSGGLEIAPGYCEVPDGVTFTTSDVVDLYVVGKCSDGNCDGKSPNGWELVTADWDRDDGLTIALTSPPSGSKNWTLRPNTIGSGYITVTRNNPGGDPLTDIVKVTITAGAPNRAELVILTPPEERIAGKPIQFEVKYFNTVGEMKEWNSSWTNNGATFADVLQGLGFAEQKEPQIVSDGKGNQTLVYVGYDGDGNVINAKLTHDLANKRDIVEIIIFNATGNPHQIQYKETIEGTPILAVSDRFTVLPGEPKKIVIEGDKVKDGKMEVLQSDPEQILHAVAVDEYGNRIGDYPGDWKATDPIPVDVEGRPVIVYVPGRAEENGEGDLCVTAVTASGVTLENCITIDLKGVTARPISAVTKDVDGCGYLDRIELTFKKAILFADGANGTKDKGKLDGKITVVNKSPSFTWTVDSVTVDPANFKVQIWLNDVAPHSGALQTGWTPTVNIYDGLFDEAGAQVVSTTDGAAPVIAYAKLFFPKESTGKVTENYIEVRFSEKVRSSKNEAFGTSRGQANTEFMPKVLFNIWGQGGQSKASLARTRALSKKAGQEPFASNINALQEDRLDGIPKTLYINDSTLWFYLENGKELSPPNDYINIRTSDQARNPMEPTPVRDAPGSVPLANNRKVPITYGNEPGGNMKAIPNPASPDPNRTREDGLKVGAGTIYATHDESAVRDIRDGKAGGTVFEVPLYYPKSGKINCQLKVYDLAGNLVISGQSDNAASGLNADDGAFTKMHLYWNGYNQKGMKVAPGTYRMVVYISYTGNLSGEDKEKAKNKKYQGIVGMSK